jgi:hypothetical protein
MMFGKSQQPSDQTSGLTPVEAPVSEALILICEKCGKNISRGADDNPSRDIVSQLKEEIRAQGGKGKLRTVLANCIGVCPEGAIAVGISRTEKPNQFFTFNGPTSEAAKAIFEKVKKESK